MAWLDREVNFSGRVGGKRGCIYFTKCHDNVLLHGSLYHIDRASRAVCFTSEGTTRTR